MLQLIIDNTLKLIIDYMGANNSYNYLVLDSYCQFCTKPVMQRFQDVIDSWNRMSLRLHRISHQWWIQGFRKGVSTGDRSQM